MRCSTKNLERGFTLVELLIAMTLALIVLTSISSAFISQRKTFNSQEQVTEMIQGARAALDMISREVRMAGYAPTGYDSQFEDDPTVAQTALKMQRTDSTAARFVGIPYSATQLQVLADIDDDAGTGVGDGDASDTHENITYTYDSANKQIDRNTGAGAQPFAENIQAFTFLCYDEFGTATTTTADIRQIDITITARTSKPDPDYGQNGGYRAYTLNSYVTPPNLGL